MVSDTNSIIQFTLGFYYGNTNANATKFHQTSSNDGKSFRVKQVTSINFNTNHV